MADAARELEPGEGGLRRALGVRDVALFATTCICGARWIAPAARAGPGSLLVWLFAAVAFAIPLAIAVAALGARHARPGGFYWWTRADFGPWHGFLCFWTYWIGNAFWFPSAAMFYMSMALAALGPRFAFLLETRAWLVVASLAALWIALGANIIGIGAGKWTENAGAIASQALMLLLGVAAWMVFARQGSASEFQLLPDMSRNAVGFWGTMAYAMSGMELVSLMGGEIRDPERTIPRAATVASLFGTLFYMVATASLLVLVEPPRIGELDGLARAGERAGAALDAGWIEPALAALVFVSAIGQFGGIGAGTSRLPFALGIDGLLPAPFRRIHPRLRTPYISMLALGGFCSVVLIAIQFGDSARAAYDTMVSLMVIGGFAPYIYIFGSAWRAGKRISAASGLAVTAIAIACSLIPTNSIGNPWLFEAKLAGGTALVVGSAWVAYRRARRTA